MWKVLSTKTQLFYGTMTELAENEKLPMPHFFQIESVEENIPFARTGFRFFLFNQ